MEYVLVSACLLGSPVRYDGGHKRLNNPLLEQWVSDGRVVSLCPELAGGLPVPRRPAELEAGSQGFHVLAGQAKVIDSNKADLSKAFVAGAHLSLQLAKRMNIRVAVLKDSSPSCGTNFIYDGTFSKIKVPGMGVTSALLESHGIKVFSEDAILEAEKYILHLECPGGDTGAQ
jgi:uncharacterized protein YbbK (DUF523 family)